MNHRVPLTAAFVIALFGCSASTRDAGPTQTSLDGDSGLDTGATDTGAVDSPPVDLSTLLVTPSNATIYIDTVTSPPTPANLTFTASLYDGEKKTDVTSATTFTVETAAFGSFTGPLFTSTDSLPGTTAVGVTTHIKATANGKTGIANLTIVQLRRSGDKRDFFFVVPYEAAPSPSSDVLKFGTNIKQADVAFNVDTTGSMSGAIDALKGSLSTTIFPNLKKAIPSVGLAVVDFKDEGDSWVTKVTQPITTDVTKAQAAVGTMSAGGGGDEPEADICSMMHIVSGKACSTTPAVTPPAGTFGAAHFRPGSLPVVVNITDAHWHDPSGGYSLATDLTTAFKKNHVRFVAITETHSLTDDLEDAANTFSDATASNVPPSAFGKTCAKDKCCTLLSGGARDPVGTSKKVCRLNFQTLNGSGLGDTVVTAIQALSVGSTFDVTAIPSNDTANPDGVDATQFIKALRAMAEGDVDSGCPPATTIDTDSDGVTDTFQAVPTGTPVCFEVIPKMNSTVLPKSDAAFYNAFIDVIGQPGSVKLDRRNVLFLVPPKDPTAK